MKTDRCCEYLLEVLPLHAEEENQRQESAEAELVSKVVALGGDPFTTHSVITVLRRLLEALVLLDPVQLSQGKWAFVSFPASLMARSVLETLATPRTTFFADDYWHQGTSQISAVVEEQRRLLRRMELQRTVNRDTRVSPIRTVHVAWGIMRFGDRYLMHKREDRTRPDVDQYVFPGGRLKPVDLDIADRNPEALSDLFLIDSVLASGAIERTLARELLEELRLGPGEYVHKHLRTLPPFAKVEGALNNHAFTQYNISVFAIQLSDSGARNTLNLISAEGVDWEWFTAQEIMAGKRPDGPRAFVDALVCESDDQVLNLLEREVPDSSPVITYLKAGDALALPARASDPILQGTAGPKQKSISISIDQKNWELLMILGWHARGLDVEALPDSELLLLGGGWIKLCGTELVKTAVELASKLKTAGIPLVDYDPTGLCRLSIASPLIYFQPACFEYLWDIESEKKPILLTLKGIDTRWASLKARTKVVNLSPKLLRAMPNLQSGHQTDVDTDTIRREFDRVLEPAKAVGLQQFLSWRSGSHEILIKSSS